MYLQVLPSHAYFNNNIICSVYDADTITTRRLQLIIGLNYLLELNLSLLGFCLQVLITSLKTATLNV
jgi:hypothetical protein